MTLHEKTLQLLRDRPRSLTYKVIAESLGITEHWVRSFANGVDEPSVNKVQRLYEFLSGQKLKV